MDPFVDEPDNIRGRIKDRFQAPFGVVVSSNKINTLHSYGNIEKISIQALKQLVGVGTLGVTFIRFI
ncbi:hypothetical protein HZS_5528 [Henneguya salminicola]|nr:hypothetical protein HZS_5528 [Henneguya salminicola]